ncbi:MAG: helix-turn-helix domain-containing protein [Candidatus Altiarchaeales archaeon]|nr:helix-turn-helix domain-containing protein [Candidatus Altiarchaeales archaeon]
MIGHNERLKVFLEMEGISQAALARSIDCSQSTVSKFINGHRESLPFHSLRKFADKYGLEKFKIIFLKGAKNDGQDDRESVLQSEISRPNAV